MQISMRLLLLGVASVALAAAVVVVWPPAADSEVYATVEPLRARAAVLEREIGLLEDQNAIEKLQRIYGFYTDKQLWTQAADLFVADGTIEVGGQGVYVGR